MVVQSVGSNIRVFAIVTFVIFASSCNIEKEPETVDAGPYIGCYADGPLKLKLDNSTLQVNGKIFSYVIQFRKIGYIINSHFIVEGSGNSVRISPSNDEYFYRIVSDGGVKSVIMTDGDNLLYTLKKQDFCWN